jgi:hypothetical protein
MNKKILNMNDFNRKRRYKKEQRLGIYLSLGAIGIAIAVLMSVYCIVDAIWYFL